MTKSTIPKLKSSKPYLTSTSSNYMESIQATERRRCSQEWKGQNTILCQGRVIGGPELFKLWRTLGLLLVPSVMFDVWVAEVYCSKYREFNVMIFGVILPIMCSLALLKTAFTDPGIIPRKDTSNKDPMWLQTMPMPPRYQDICVDGTTVRFKFCSTCRIFRPPRSFHCPICDNCVERFDHHCPWIGTCIGSRNYG
jgi:palmitoyltransferase ZDHHC9/14/18